jgi:hypothetical protein
LAIGSAQQQMMAVHWDGQTQQLHQGDLQGCRRRQIVAAHHVADACSGVVDDRGQKVGDAAVAAADEGIADVRQIAGEIAAAQIFRGYPACGQPHAQASSCVFPPARRNGSAPTASVIVGWGVSVATVAPGQISTAAVTNVESPLRRQPIEGSGVGASVVALAAYGIEGQPQPLQGRRHRLGVGGPTALWVEIFET